MPFQFFRAGLPRLDAKQPSIIKRKAQTITIKAHAFLAAVTRCDGECKPFFKSGRDVFDKPGQVRYAQVPCIGGPDVRQAFLEGLINGMRFAEGKGEGRAAASLNARIFPAGLP